MELRHIFFTRFNIASAGTEQAIRLAPGWLAGRFSLFADYCLPAVAAQTIQNFEWVVFFDEATPAEFCDRISALQTRFPFHAAFTQRVWMHELAPEAAAGFVACNWLLTSRLDSDDVLAVDHVERLHELCVERRERVINFDDGVILSLTGKNAALYEHRDNSSPFASMLEPMGPNIRTIWGANHRRIGDLGAVQNVSGRDGWMQIVHGSNVSNTVRGHRVSLRSRQSLFPTIDLRKLGENEKGSAILVENFVQRPIRFLNRVNQTILKKIRASLKAFT